ncbi:MAG: RiPP maturation radical SAM C-methyltransferase [Proteobacteria bacterium]|nr:RiPP maturation radical SAM C-methyltransferase [Pseudomonadota bacterium]
MKSKIGLFSTPWPIFNRPSIQLGTLKAWLLEHLPGIGVECSHPYLKIAEEIGYKRYQAISEKSWLAECVYATILYPERLGIIQPLFNQMIKGSPELQKTDLRTLSNQVQKISEDFIDQVNWQDFKLVGFSVCLCQLSSAKYFMQAVREKCSSMNIVAGGSIISGMTNHDLHKFFKGVSFFIKGEGERPFCELVKWILKEQNHHHFPVVSDIVNNRLAANKTPEAELMQIEDLQSLPVPDFDDYFSLLDAFPPNRKFFPVIPVELSRGCWWHGNEGGKKKGCSFCNLNSQWKGYRSKQPAQVVYEIDTLTRKHKSLSISVMDNVLPFNGTGDYFSGIASIKKDFSIFCEVRANIRPIALEQMKLAGVDHVQVGIESLSSNLLKKLNKGTTAIQNIQIMRDLEELNIANGSNLMLHFPGADQNDVSETLHALEFVFPFRPLKIVEFQLAQGSEVSFTPLKFGVKQMMNHPNYSIMYPESISDSIQFMQKIYRGDRLYQKKLWRPVRKKVRIWEKTYETLHRKPGFKPILYYMDGGSFILIRQRHLNGQMSHHRLEGKSAQIYLFCTRNRSFKKIISQFNDLSPDKIKAFLSMMVDKKAMFTENDRYLSLAISIKKNRFFNKTQIFT